MLKNKNSDGYFYAADKCGNIGMPEDEVRELLGAPDYQDTAACLSYVIAQPFDEVTLDLTLKSGIVTQVEQTSH